jgi:hypothetical protein
VNASNKIDAIDEQLVHDIMESCAKKIHECWHCYFLIENQKYIQEVEHPGF